MGQLYNPTTHPTHVSDRLVPYLTGALSETEVNEVEVHMAGCRDCRDEGGALSGLAVGIGMLSPQQVGSLAQGGREHKLVTRRSEMLSARAVLPYAAAAVLGLAMGAGGWAWLGPDHHDEVPVSSSAPPSAAPTLAVTMTNVSGGMHQVEAVAVGLSPGVAFDLLAVANDGRVYLVAHAVAAGGPQTVTGRLPVGPPDIRFFALVSDDGRIINARP
jgi:hypothetical protein